MAVPTKKQLKADQVINFTYECERCGDRQSSKTMNSFICDCSGTYKCLDLLQRSGSNFEPHYSPEIKQYVHSWADAEKKGKAFRSPEHPNGFILTQSNRRFINECKNIKKNREDFIQETYSKGEMKKDASGNWKKVAFPKYKPGKKVKLDETTRSFVAA